MPEQMRLEDAKKLCADLKEKGVEARSFWKPVHLQKPYADCPKSEVKVAEDLWQRIVTMPCSTNITETELVMVVEALNALLI